MQAMNPRHHLDEATLLSYAAGALPVALATVAATHLGVCAACRRQLHVAERLGGGLIAIQPEAPHAPGAREAMLARLDEPFDDEAGLAEHVDAATDPDALPVPLHPYFGRSLSALRWRWIGPGTHCVRAKVDEGQLLLVRIAPGKAMPMHGHRGGELTYILQGAYDDEFGHFGPGDIADLGDGDRHRPVMAAGLPCIGVSGLDGKLRYESWLARMMQPFSGL